jgi:hypothetical protein
MSYFTPKSTWLSLVDGPGSAAPVHDGKTLSFEDYRPCFPGPGESGGGDGGEPVAVSGDQDQESLRITRDLRHRLFFHFKEWEFGPALLEDHLLLAQAQTVPEEALAHYCHARHVARTLVERCGQEEFLLPWLETDRIIAEVHALIGNRESCALYAREGLDTIKRNRFDSSMDMRITKLAVRFFKLLEQAGPGTGP